jgi:hypothetical protein
MQPFRMRYLPFISLMLMFISCTSPYKHLTRTKGDLLCVQQFRPAFSTAMYNTNVDVVGNHISGILLLKTMPDSSIRLVFSTKAGFKFFDFGFTKDSGFRVYYILKQMDKKPFITALRKDFELILLEHTEPGNGYLLQNDSLHYYAFTQEKGVNYYVTDTACSRLFRIEKSSKHKVIVRAIMERYTNGLPDTIGISHKNFKFDIALKRIENNALR